MPFRQINLPSCLLLTATSLTIAWAGSAYAADPATVHHYAAAPGVAPLTVVATREKLYADQVEDAMSVMSSGMARAPMPAMRTMILRQ
ncbi:MAG: hypothetical protein NVSMB6_16820 [Burkholderiaceae bacterium]